MNWYMNKLLIILLVLNFKTFLPNEYDLQKKKKIEKEKKKKKKLEYYNN